MVASLHSVAQHVSDVWAIAFPPVALGYFGWLLWHTRRKG